MKATWGDLVRLAENYRKYFKDQRISPRELPPDVVFPATRDAALSHASWMLGETEGVFDQLSFSDLARILGFIQGLLLTAEDFTLGELEGHWNTGGVRKK